MVNLFVLGRDSKSKTFHQQAIDLKKIIGSTNEYKEKVEAYLKDACPEIKEVVQVN